MKLRLNSAKAEAQASGLNLAELGNMKSQKKLGQLDKRFKCTPVSRKKVALNAPPPPSMFEIRLKNIKCHRYSFFGTNKFSISLYIFQ